MQAKVPLSEGSVGLYLSGNFNLQASSGGNNDINNANAFKQ